MRTNRKNHYRNLLTAVVVASCAWALAAGASTTGDDPPQTLSSGGASSSAPSQSLVERLSFVEGAWTGMIGDAKVDEYWSAPDSDHMMGMFRWINSDGSVQVMEMMSITKEDDGVFLRFRHFDAKLTPWESEDEPETLRLAKLTKSSARFEPVKEDDAVASITYSRTSKDVLDINVDFSAEGRGDLNFTLKPLSVANAE